ncbi:MULTISPECIES: FAD-dependent oxidoreductase [unclassified Spirosoma]|uniref:FAD-dependent oxidoreductase n=1 Tax=unclassified Spirosoma TaxID=2621999 RepID=UPI00096044D6|nr:MULTISPECIES: FAD-dependent oxidoreductase [unclassified Spirosoma]MBN8823499.1 FAD-dependent oxidoreductase [Spirosoma sp.]OJW71893.1 MAG: xanthan lyase [Spirosoma sp. 48-14]
MKSILSLCLMLLCWTFQSFSPHQATTYDIVVYGGTPSGVIAAVAAAREGARVILLEQTRHVGGLNTSGIGTAESEHMIEETISGLPLEFYQRLGKFYGINGPTFYFESHVAEKTFLDLLKEANVTVVYDAFVQSATKRGTTIQSITLTNGNRYTGSVFIDATYEGDLMAKAGVSHTHGRENREQYGESLAGVRFIDTPIDASPYDDKGKLLPGFVERSTLTEGQASDRVMNYNFRLMMSTHTDRRPFPKPAAYNPKRYLLLTRLLKNHPETKLRDIIDLYAWNYPKGKFETNNKQKAVISLGHFGGNVDYPEASYSRRKAIYDDHKAWTLGLMYYLANDPSVPDALRQETASYGFSADEFTDNENFPYYLYVREARRMIGAYIQTQKDILDERTKPDAICLGSHWIDSHHVQRVAVSKTQFVNEGRIWESITQPYEVSYRAITPKPNECTNLLVPVCVSASHVGFCSLRVESTWMQLGNSAGIAAAMAFRQKKAVQQLATSELQTNLRQKGVIISVNHQTWNGTKDIK